MRRALTALIIASALALAACGDDDGDTTSQEPTAQEEPSAEQGCVQVEQPPAKDVKLEAPSGGPPAAGTTVVFETSCGSFSVELDVKDSPKTSESFAYLAEQGVFDDTPFHRIAPGFVIQGGDPKGDGTGGPGYSVDEPPPDNAAYTEAVVAMAKSAAEPPGRSGSQFFVVTGPDTGLPPDYALVGEVTEGFEVVKAIEALGAGPGTDGPPTQPVQIETATVE